MKLFDKEYMELRSFIRFYYDNYSVALSLPEDQRPIAILERFEGASPSQACKSLEMGVNDCVERSSDWSPEKIASANEAFKNAGLLLLTEIRRRYSKKYLQILKRGLIRSEADYYLAKEIINGGSIEPGATEAQKLASMLRDYEQIALSNKGEGNKGPC
jgi:hypothetical protein